MGRPVQRPAVHATATEAAQAVILRRRLQVGCNSWFVAAVTLKKWSERGDLNSRPPVPQTGALTELRYAPTL